MKEAEELRQAKEEIRVLTDELRRSNSELEQFARIASHDLQEPLRKVQTFGDMLRMKCGDTMGAEGLDYLERMQKASARMGALINDLLIYSRITSRAQPLVTLNLNDIVRDAVEALESRIQSAGAILDIGPLPMIVADPPQMRQLFENLFSNAVKFRKPDAAPHIRVRAATVKDRIEITVADDGIGFEPKYADRIFEVFERLHGRNEYEGTGVGLAICRKIARRHGGEITGTGTLGAGATFTLTLPKR